MKTKVALIGCGTIGSALADALARDRHCRLVAVVDKDRGKAEALAGRFRPRPRITGLEPAVGAAGLVIEAAGIGAVKELLRCRGLDRKGKRLLVMSTGGLVESLGRFNRLRHCRVTVPSGALAGLDAVRAVRGRIASLALETTKPPRGLAGAPYLEKRKIRLEGLKSAKKIFEGGLRDALHGFPQNVNVAAGLYLASRFPKIRVRIKTDPRLRVNRHVVTCRGAFGEIKTVTRCRPDANPKTSRLAALSAVAALREMLSEI
jgi:aspartate dehydrogenase